MQKNQYIPLSLITVAILSGCGSVPQKNAALSDAHSIYDSARANPQVTTQAALELKEAGDSLNIADEASSKGQDAATVNHLSYLANQKVRFAQETAMRKASELEVANASTKRDHVLLEARTAEADAAKQQVAIVQETTNRQAAALTDARANAESDQSRLKAAKAETDAAKQQVVFVSEIADAQAAALADADANAASNQASLAAKTAEADEAKKQVVSASAKAERDQSLIAQQEFQINELNAKKTKRGLVITLGDVLFGTNKAQLESGGLRNAHKLADFLKQFPQQRVSIEGFTDSTGSESFNQELSDRRANAVKTALLDMGISSSRVSTRGYGEAFPVASNGTAASRQLNRRVEIIFSDDNGNIAPR